MSSLIDYAKLLGFETAIDGLASGVDFQNDTIDARLGAKVGFEEQAPAGTVDYAKLVGFETVCDRMTGGVDFQDVTVAAKLGAKIGNEEDAPGNTR